MTQIDNWHFFYCQIDVEISEATLRLYKTGGNFRFICHFDHCENVLRNLANVAKIFSSDKKKKANAVIIIQISRI